MNAINSVVYSVFILFILVQRSKSASILKSKLEVGENSEEVSQLSPNIALLSRDTNEIPQNSILHRIRRFSDIYHTNQDARIKDIAAAKKFIKHIFKAETKTNVFNHCIEHYVLKHGLTEMTNAVEHCLLKSL